MNSKAITAKHNLLVNSFLTLFPKCEYEWKNSQGIFNTIGRCMVKRSVCFSARPVGECSLFGENAEKMPEEKSFWVGLCGIESTRANKATDTLFILCYKVNKRFVAVATVSFRENPNSETGFSVEKIDFDGNKVDQLLEGMKKEKESFSETMFEKRRNRKGECFKRQREENTSSPLLFLQQLQERSMKSEEEEEREEEERPTKRERFAAEQEQEITETPSESDSESSDSTDESAQSKVNHEKGHNFDYYYSLLNSC